MQLVDLRPNIDATDLANRFRPPPRFDSVRFGTYRPDAEFPSQSHAQQHLQAFVTRSADKNFSVRRLAERLGRKSTAKISGLYLDGGFGVGKTHLLAAAWHQHQQHGPSAFLTFGELVAYIGFAGMDAASRSLGNCRLICIDEFELDDVANTLMVVTFLRQLEAAAADDIKVVVTSNTLPDRLGEGRFAAEDFKREIAAIANRFEIITIDGSDFRGSHSSEIAPLEPPTLDTVTKDDFDELVTTLGQVHPVQYGALLDGIDAVVITGAHQLKSQDDALLFVQLVDKLYDACIPVRIEGAALEEVFGGYYRHGGYRKKYGRAESRIAAMAAESADLLF